MARAAETHQPQALPLCAARGDRADRERRPVRAGRYRPRQQAGLVPEDLAARQDAGACGRRQGDLRVRGDSRIPRGDAAESAASERSAGARRASRLDRVQFRRARRHLGPRDRNRRGDLCGEGETAGGPARRAGEALVGTPWFDGESFSLVDAVFGAAFRYFDVIDEIGDFGIFANTPKIVRWRNVPPAAASIRNAVSADYPQLLRDFLKKKGAYLSQLEARKAA